MTNPNDIRSTDDASALRRSTDPEANPVIGSAVDDSAGIARLVGVVLCVALSLAVALSVALSVALVVVVSFFGGRVLAMRRRRRRPSVSRSFLARRSISSARTTAFSYSLRAACARSPSASHLRSPSTWLCSESSSVTEYLLLCCALSAAVRFARASATNCAPSSSTARSAALDAGRRAASLPAQHPWCTMAPGSTGAATWS